MQLKIEQGCRLWIEDGHYILDGGRSGRHTLSVEHTSPERLESHWQNYLRVNPLRKWRVTFLCNEGVGPARVMADGRLSIRERNEFAWAQTSDAAEYEVYADMREYEPDTRIDRHLSTEEVRRG